MQQLSHREIGINHTIYTNLDMCCADGWSQEFKFANFEALIKIADYTKIPLKGASCLDIGCGTGDFSRFLRKRGIAHYLGVDIYEPAIIIARERFPQERFEFIDILAWQTEERFDYVFCSGALSTNFDVDNYAFLEAMVKKMWGLSRIGISFNFFTEECPTKIDMMFFYSLDRVLDICKGIIGNGKIDYSEKDYQAHVYLWR